MFGELINNNNNNNNVKHSQIKMNENIFDIL